MLIKKYNTDANRRAWQAFLNTQNEKLQVDGKIGPLSIAATKRFQAKHGLIADGIVGENTISAALVTGWAGLPEQIHLPGDTPKPRNKTILVSAGHTNKQGFDQGVVANGLVEGQQAVVVRDAVSALLRKEGFIVREDGADGVNEPLSKALALISGTSLAIEIHFNGGPAAATGVEVLSLPARKIEAQAIAAAISNALGLKLRGASGWKSDTEGQHSRLAFCRKGGLVVEVCFLTNPSDVAAYKKNFDKLTRGIAEAISASV